MLLWLLFTFMLGLLGGWGAGGDIASLERVRNCSHVMGRYVSQQCQMRTGCCAKTVRSKFFRIFRMSYRLDLSKRTESFEILFFFKNIRSFLLNIFTFTSPALTERTNDFILKKIILTS